MNLLHFDTKSDRKVIFFNNVSLGTFLTVCADSNAISIVEMYAHNPKQEFDISDLKSQNNISSILNLPSEHDDLFIDYLKILLDQFEITINEEYEYQIVFWSSELLSSDFCECIKSLLKIDSGPWNSALLQDLQYLLIKNGAIIKSFGTFDDFLESEFSDLED